MKNREITKSWDPMFGFTRDEANSKKHEADAMYGTGSPNSKWQCAKVVLDTDKLGGGYKVVISPKRQQ